MRFEVRHVARDRPELHAVDRAALRREIEARAAELELAFDVLDARPALRIIERAAGHLRRDLEYPALVVGEREILEPALQAEAHVAGFARDDRALEPPAYPHE